MRVLVTGASGHVGGAIGRALAEAGHETIGLSRHAPRDPGLDDYLEADIADQEAMRRVVSRVGRADAVVHSAALLDKEPLSVPVALTNCAGTQAALWAAREMEAFRFIYISGVTVIGTPLEKPITERHPTAPLTTYHATKLSGEHLVTGAATAGISGASLRLTSPAGPGLPEGRIMSVFVRRAEAGEPITLLGEGSRRQNYVDVRDVGDAVLRALPRTETGVFNVAAAGTVSNRELAEICVTELASSSEIVHQGTDPEEGVDWDVSIERARDAFGWVPRLSVPDSIRALANSLG